MGSKLFYFYHGFIMVSVRKTMTFSLSSFVESQTWIKICNEPSRCDGGENVNSGIINYYTKLNSAKCVKMMFSIIRLF